MQSHQVFQLSLGTPREEFLPRAGQLRPNACQEWAVLQVSRRASVVKTIIPVIFSPSIYRKQTLPSCPLPVAENRQAKQMSRDGRGVLQAAASLESKQAPREPWGWGWRWGVRGRKVVPNCILIPKAGPCLLSVPATPFVSFQLFPTTVNSVN